jgi:diaminopimelate decarboxylase
MQFLFTVIDKKDRDLVITDAGTNVIGWERFEVDYFPILNLSRSDLIERPCQVLGSLCTPHDVWGYSYFGRNIQPGDLLMIPCQGAYTYSLGQRFIKSLPKVVRI